MNLQELITRLARETGLKVANDQQTLVDLINDAARELYEQTDLPRSLMEQTIQVSNTNTTQRITLPAHMAEVRGIRDYNRSVTLHDLRPRYHNYPWPKGNLYTFRMCEDAATSYSWDNAIAVTIAPFDDDVTISITGSTDEAAQYTATFSRTGVAPTIDWTDIFSVSKSARTAADIVLTDPDGVEVSRILNFQSAARYIQIELLERPQTPLSPAVLQPGRILDVLYKPYYRPLFVFTDVFQIQGYDYAIINKALELFRLRGIDGTNVDAQIKAAQVAGGRSNDLLNNVLQSRTQAQEIQIQFGDPKGDLSKLRGLRRYKYRRQNY